MAKSARKNTNNEKVLDNKEATTQSSKKTKEKFISFETEATASDNGCSDDEYVTPEDAFGVCLKSFELEIIHMNDAVESFKKCISKKNCTKQMIAQYVRSFLVQAVMLRVHFASGCAQLFEQLIDKKSH